MSTHPHPAGEPAGFADPSTVAVHTAIFASTTDVKRAENELGLLCADDQIELLDGVLIDWPVGAARPSWRALRNVPRMSALAETVWDEWLDRLDSAPPAGTKFGPGGSAIVAFAGAGYRTMLATQLTGSGAHVSTIQLSAADYARLRRPARG